MKMLQPYPMIKLFLPTYLVLQFLLCASAEKIDQLTWEPGNIVDLPNYGRIQGVRMYSHFTKRLIHGFMGINYAEAPIKQLRFQPPQPVPKWSPAIYNATRLRQRCPQLDDPYYPYLPTENVHNTSNIEDCLVLNVYTPQLNKSGEVLPVLFHIHGGSFYVSSSQYFLPHFLLEKNIVLVTIQYRLGPVGFATLQTEDISGNAGALDMVMALQWVHDNIRHFGGDPTRVTLEGESAGAAGVTALLLSPLVPEGLFTQVIAQSGSVTTSWGFIEDMVAPTKQIASALNCNSDDLSIIAKCLTGAPIQRLLEVSNSAMRVGPNFALTAQTAGTRRFLEEPPIESLKSGKFKKVPMIMGCTRDEGSAGAQVIYDQLLTDGAQRISKNYTEFYMKILGGRDVAVEVVDVYYNRTSYNKTVKEAMPAMVDLAGALAFKAPTIQFARAMADHVPVYFYSFQFQGNASKLARSLPDWDKTYPFSRGVAHSDDVSYLFPLFNYSYTQRELAMVQTLTDLWTNFIIKGTPTPKGEWKALSDEFGPYLRIAETPQLRQFFLDEYNVAEREGFLKTSGGTDKNSSTFITVIIMSVIAILRK